jgi:hydrogenase maturation protein HypF
MLGLCRVATYHAEGPMRLESMVLRGFHDRYEFKTDGAVIFDDMAKGIVKDLSGGIDRRIIATKFHNTIIAAIFETVKAIAGKENIGRVVLSGGVFQNKYLLEETVSLLESNGLEVFTHAAVPTNDGGIALGQLAVASKRRTMKCV